MKAKLIATFLCLLPLAVPAQAHDFHFRPALSKLPVKQRAADQRLIIRHDRIVLHATRWVKAMPADVARFWFPSAVRVRHFHAAQLQWTTRELGESERMLAAARSSSVLGGANFSMWQRLVLGCEAKGLADPWYANTGNGFYFGPQFTTGTWSSSGGAPFREGFGYGAVMHSFSVAYIVARANEALRQQGPGAWPWCHAHGYL